MTDKEIIERAKAAEKRTMFGEIVHNPISNGVNSAYGIGFIEGMEEYRSSLPEESAIDLIDMCKNDNRIQYASIEAGIQAHAETYSFNIESELFNQLTKEQQALWRKEIEQACISGGDVGVELARDPRYKENLEVKEVDEQKERIEECPYRKVGCTMYEDKILKCNGACGWVVDYLNLKKLKAQKGE